MSNKILKLWQKNPHLKIPFPRQSRNQNQGLKNQKSDRTVTEEKVKSHQTNPPGLLVLLKSKKMEADNQDPVKKELEECQGYHYSQSSKVSSLSRNIVYGIIGTCWVLIYANNHYNKPCTWLIIALGLSFVYLLLDLAHYFSDSCSYRKEYFRLDRDKKTEGILYRHEEYMDGVSKRSFHLLIAKFICVLVIAVIFVIGILRQLEIF